MTATLKASEIRNVSLANILALLNSDHWNASAELSNDKFNVFMAPDFIGAPQKITLPRSIPDDFRKTQEYVDFIKDAVSKLAYIYDINPVLMAGKISGMYSGTDVIALRLFPEQAVDDIPLPHICSVIDDLVSLVEYSAMSELNSQKQYYARMTGKGKEAASNFNFMHTFEGSFGIRIKSKFSYQRSLFENEDYLREDVPVARRITERLLLGITKTEQATASNTPKIIIDNYKSGFNANMCLVMSEMFMDNGFPEIAWNFGLDPAVPLLPEISSNVNKDLRVKRESVLVLRAAGNDLIPADDEVDRRTFVGTVTETRSKYENMLDIAKTVKIEGEKKGDPSFLVEMDGERFRLAETAHDEHKKIIISGDLSRNGIRWVLNNVTEFRLIEE